MPSGGGGGTARGNNSTDNNEAEGTATTTNGGGGGGGGESTAGHDSIKPTIISVDGGGGGEVATETEDPPEGGGGGSNHLQVFRSPVARTISNRSSVAGGNDIKQPRFLTYRIRRSTYLISSSKTSDLEALSKIVKGSVGLKSRERRCILFKEKRSID